MKYRSEIDGLRALAVVPVILFHAGFRAFSGGFVGVDVFFVISGYLITTILLADMRAGNFSIVHFYERRVRRILPALFVVMFVSFVFAWLSLLPRDMKQFSERGLAIYDPIPLFCRGAECEYMSGGKPLYNDQDHLSVFGSRLVMQDMRQRGILSDR